MPSQKSLTPERRRRDKPVPAAHLWPGKGLAAGVDEAGRGPLAGPVFAAAVILDDRKPIDGLADSKLLAEPARERLFDEICAKALCVCVAQASTEEIDRFNILQATMLAMHRAVNGLRILPARVLVDGNRRPPLSMPCEAVVKGDGKVSEIAAASILAKVSRDRWCLALDERWPGYGFAQHKGYPTPEHLQQLRHLGPSPEHRRSFAPVRALLPPGTVPSSLPLPLGIEQDSRA
jgi:ribonuclease HII